MPSIITSAILGAINNGLQTSFNDQLYRTVSPHSQFCFDASSTGASEVYPRLDLMRGPREWLGDRLAQQLSQSSFSIVNRKFEQTITIGRTDIEDDKYGMYSAVASEMGNAANVFPARLVADLMKSGINTVGVDGQYFFDIDHPGWDSAGAATTVSNYTSGADPGFYLIDNSRYLKPFIFQTRVPFQLTTRFNLDDPNVFDRDEFVWGTRGRMNAGFGVWQLVYFSKATFNQANIIAARNAMAALYRPDGSPFGINPDTIVVPSANYIQAKSYFENAQVADNPTAPTTLVENKIRGMFKPIEFPWLN